jgi:hypothetical protein
VCWHGVHSCSVFLWVSNIPLSRPVYCAATVTCLRLSAASFYPAHIPCLLGQSLIMVVLLSLLLSLVRANARAVAHPAAEGNDSLLWLFGVARFPEHVSPSSYLPVQSLGNLGLNV